MVARVRAVVAPVLDALFAAAVRRLARTPNHQYPACHWGAQEYLKAVPGVLGLSCASAPLGHYLPVDSYSLYNSKAVYVAVQKRYSFKNWFMTRNQFSTDGFVMRRRAQGVQVGPRKTLDSVRGQVPSQYLMDPAKQARPAQTGGAPALVRSGNPLNGNAELNLPKPAAREKVDIDMSLDQPPQEPPKGRRSAKGKKGPRQRPPLKKILKRAGIVLGILLIIGVGYFGYKFLTTSGKVFKGNPIAAIFNEAQPLKEDANGQSNILLFGTSEDDPSHPGADLTDSIMLLSVNQKRKDAYVVSIPRDLYVDYGRACTSGYKGKVNVVYSCGKQDGSEEAGANLLRQKVGEIFGVDVQYFAHVNYTVMRQAVDAVGGITVNIESDDPRGILDRNFDWDCPKGVMTCYNVKYPNGPATLNGKQALYLARARGDHPVTYGLSRSNPDRQDNQRKILIALKDKAVSAGVLANPIAVNNLLDALGDNLRTNFETAEIKTLMDLGKNVQNSSITSWSLEDPERPLATVTCLGGNICPNAGTLNYSEIQKVNKALATADLASLENAKVDVLNASGTAGLAQTKASELTAKNITVGIVGNAPTSLGPNPVQFYDMTGGKKPGTLKKLESLLGVKVTAGTPAGVSTNSSFVVIIGAQPQAQTQQ
jgi:LCP family protein required for cell wall assembly